MVKITRAEIKKLLATMEDNKIDELELDVYSDYGRVMDVINIEFDWYECNEFIKTLLTIEENT